MPLKRRIYLPLAYIERSLVLSTMTSILFAVADRILDTLHFNGCINPHFREDGIGKIGTTGFVLGFIGGIHLAVGIMSTILLFYVDFPFLYTIRMWGIYMGMLCCFHFLEFFITAVRQSSTLSFDSFIITHGRSYTLAAGMKAIHYNKLLLEFFHFNFCS